MFPLLSIFEIYLENEWSRIELMMMGEFIYRHEKYMYVHLSACIYNNYKIHSHTHHSCHFNPHLIDHQIDVVEVVVVLGMKLNFQ